MAWLTPSFKSGEFQSCHSELNYLKKRERLLATNSSGNAFQREPWQHGGQITGVTKQDITVVMRLTCWKGRLTVTCKKEGYVRWKAHKGYWGQYGDMGSDMLQQFHSSTGLWQQWTGDTISAFTALWQDLLLSVNGSLQFQQRHIYKFRNKSQF